MIKKLIFHIKNFYKKNLVISRIISIFIVAVILLVSFLIFDFKYDNNLNQNFFNEVDFIEETQAEEISEKEIIDNNEEIDNKDIEINDDFAGITNEDDKKNIINPNEIKKNIPKEKPNSIMKYGLVFYHPHQYKKDDLGRMVCIHDKDKPKISNQNKPVHQDMECCLDPDEIPNPYCYYSRKKYGKILDDFERKKEKMIRRYHEGKGI